MSIRLKVTMGPDKDKSFTIEAGEMPVVGRSSKADITIRDMGISRIHCQLKYDGHRCVIEDLNSKNGTLVNGRKIEQPTPVSDNDIIKLGTSIIRVGSAFDESTEGGSELELDLFEDEAEEEGAHRKAPNSAGAHKEDSQAAPKPPAPGSGAGKNIGALDRLFEEEKTPSGQPAGNPGQAAEGTGAPPAQPREEASSPHLEPGAVIAGCRIEKETGADSLSTKYLATQLSMDRPVELRILSKELTKDERAIKRFTEAARAAGRLTHPHILQVYDAGQTDDEIYYIALELAEGNTLRELFRQAGRGNPLPLNRALTISEQTAGALAHAHMQDICHGAISLNNILVTNHGITKLAELGFAKGLEDAGIEPDNNRRQITQFSAPEQLQIPPQIDPWTDVYAMGVCLFMMLSGHQPFAAANDAELEDKIIRGEHESLQSLRPSLPPDLYYIVNKSMEADPRNRYPNAGELHRSIARIRERYQ